MNFESQACSVELKLKSHGELDLVAQHRLEQSLLEVRTETKCSSAELTMLEAWLQVK
jgi:hypothetical protein